MAVNRKLGDLQGNPNNPRRITDAKLRQLAQSLSKFGDLSGVVYNTVSKQLVSGHQRAKALPPDASITITKQYSEPTPTGTVAEGYVNIKGDRYAYRETQWDAATEKAASLSANANAGTWDLPKVALWMEDLKAVDFDLNLTMFDAPEIDMLRYELPVDKTGEGYHARPQVQPSGPYAEAQQQKGMSGGAVEFSEQDFNDLTHTCPRCGFGFNG